MSRIPVLIVGAGAMAERHAEAVASGDLGRVCGIVADDPGGALALAGRHGAPAFRTLREALARCAASAAFVCTPTHTHRRITETLAASGLHVFCEKPLAPSLRDAEAVVHACRKARVTLMVGHVLRFFPAFRLLRELVAEGRLGRLAVIRMTRGGRHPVGHRNWYADRRSSGGPLLDLLIHDFDWIRWTAGPITRVHARAVYRPGTAYALCVLRLASGVLAHLEGYWGHDLPFRAQAELAGSGGLATFDSAQSASVSIHRAATSPSRRVPLDLPPPATRTPYAIEDEHFLDSIRRERAPAVTGEEALESVRASLAAIRSARTGKPVSLS